MRNLRLFIIGFLVVFFQTYGQEKIIHSANQHLDKFAYSDAIKVYEKLVANGFSSIELLENIANAHYMQGNYSDAKNWFDQLFTKTLETSANNYAKYIVVLKSENQHQLALDWIKKMKLKYPNDKRADLFSLDFNMGKNLITPKTPKIWNAGFNTEYYEYAPTPYNEQQIVITSTKIKRTNRRTKDLWTTQYFSDLFLVHVDSSSVPKNNFEPLHTNINKDWNESSAVFSKDGKTVYFTANNYQKVKGNKKSKVLLKIYRAVLQNNQWTQITELPFNSNSYSCAHPALNAEESYLYFSSDMPDTKGESDLYRVKLDGEKFGTPENLGDEINTGGRETFPYINQNNQLFFASDGRNGLGGLDIYYAFLQDEKAIVYNIPSPINSNYDDFGLVFFGNHEKGFFTSNRKENNFGKDDIFGFKDLQLIQKGLLHVVVKNEGNELVDAEVQVFDSNGIIQQKTVFNGNSYDINNILVGKEYTIKILNSHYNLFIKTIVLDESNKSVEVILTEKTPDFVEVDLAKVLKLKPIYFDLNKHFIRKDAAIELHKIYEILQKYPEIKIEIRSHTDSRNSVAYNQVLSQKRANSTMDWLIKMGISADRLLARGFGESKLINECADDIKCSEEAHQLNRRSEFIIVN